MEYWYTREYIQSTRLRADTAAAACERRGVARTASHAKAEHRLAPLR